jgi:hypothetical protein
MANPNIVNVTTITGNTVVVAPIGTSGNTILSNPTNSSTVYKVDSITISNPTASAATINVAFNSAAAGAGSNTYLIYNISVPSSATLVVTDKTRAFYVPENTSVVVSAGTGGILQAMLTYESIS